MNTNTTQSRTQVRRATPADRSAVAQTLAQAFHTDPVFGWCLPDDHRRRAILPRFFALVADALWKYDEIHVAGEGDAAALWIPADTIPADTAGPADQAAEPDPDDHEFERQLAEILGEDAARTFAIVELLEQHHPAPPHQYLWFLGVRPHAQGRGTGSALLADMLRRCDANHQAAYLEATSERNRQLYERHGFEVVQELRLTGSPSLYSPSLWAMWRAPR